MSETNNLNIRENSTPLENEEYESNAIEETKTFLDKTIGNIVEGVQHFLTINPPMFGPAHQYIRSHIENYCKYEKGFDLNDVFLKNKPIVEKFCLAKIEPAKIHALAEIYSKANEYIHNSETLLHLSLETKKEETIRNANQLKELHIDVTDVKSGLQRLYVAQDRRFAAMIENGECNPKTHGKEIGYYFKRMNNIREAMRHCNVPIPSNIKFKDEGALNNYLFLEDIRRRNNPLSFNEQARLLAIYEQKAQNGDFEACLWVANHYYMLVETNIPKAAEYYKRSMGTYGFLNKFSSTYPADEEKIQAGYALYQIGEYDAALRWVDKILYDNTALIVAGDCYHAQGKLEEAIKKYSRVSAEALTSDRRKKLVADSFYNTDPARALKYYACCEATDTDPEIILHMGDCLTALGEKEKAFMTYAKIVSVPEDSTCKRQVLQNIIRNYSCRWADTYEYRTYARTYNIWESTYLERVNSDYMTKESVLAKIADTLWEIDEKESAIDWYWCVFSRRHDHRGVPKSANYYLEKWQKNQNVSDLLNAIKWLPFCNPDHISKTDDLVLNVMRLGRFDEYSRFQYDWTREAERILCGKPIDSDTVAVYEGCKISALSDKTQKAVGDYYLNLQETEKAAKWYAAYAEKSGDGSFATNMAKRFWSEGHRDAAAILFSGIATNTKDAEVASLLADYYQSKNDPENTAKWQDQYYRFSKLQDEEMASRILHLYEQCNNEKLVLEWKKILADLKYDHDKIDDAIKLYEEYNKKHFDEAIVLRLAECYHIRKRYFDARNMLKAYTRKDVTVDDGFALVKDGALFLAHQKRLVKVEPNMIAQVEFKNIPLSKEKRVVLTLNGYAPKELPESIVLFESASMDHSTVRQMVEVYSCDKIKLPKARKAKSSRPLLTQKDIKMLALFGVIALILINTVALFFFPSLPVDQNNIDHLITHTIIPVAFGVCAIIAICSLLAKSFSTATAMLVAVINLIGIYIGANIARTANGYSYWTWISCGTFVLSMLAVRFLCRRRWQVSTAIAYSFLVIQSLFNQGIQWWYFLDPSENEIYVFDFGWYGMILPAIAWLICVILFFVAVMDENLPKSRNK